MGKTFDPIKPFHCLKWARNHTFNYSFPWQSSESLLQRFGKLPENKGDDGMDAEGRTFKKNLSFHYEDGSRQRAALKLNTGGRKKPSRFIMKELQHIRNMS